MRVNLTLVESGQQRHSQHNSPRSGQSRAISRRIVQQNRIPDGRTRDIRVDRLKFRCMVFCHLRSGHRCIVSLRIYSNAVMLHIYPCCDDGTERWRGQYTNSPLTKAAVLSSSGLSKKFLRSATSTIFPSHIRAIRSHMRFAWKRLCVTTTTVLFLSSDA